MRQTRIFSIAKILSFLCCVCLSATSIAEEPLCDKEVEALGARTNRTLKQILDLYRQNDATVESYKGKRILDIGTGGGRFVEELRERGVDAVGVDRALSEEQRGKSYFFQANATRLPFESESFDFIYSSLSVFYDGYGNLVSDSEFSEALREAARVLKPKGRFYNFEANPERMMRLLSPIRNFQVIEPSGVDILKLFRPTFVIERSSGVTGRERSLVK